MQQAQPLLHVPWTAGKIFQVSLCLTMVMVDKKTQDIAVSASLEFSMTAGMLPHACGFPGYLQAGAVRLLMHVSQCLCGA